MFKNIILYSLFRLLLLLVVAAIIIGMGLLLQVKVPILVALIFGLLVTAPLSFLLGRPLRDKVVTDILVKDSTRKNKRTRLQAELNSTRIDQ